MSDTFTKDPAAELDYSVDWTAWLEEDEEITDVDWAFPSGITCEVRVENTEPLQTIWISGGSPGRGYRITNHIRTNMNRVDERTLMIRVRER